MLNELMYKKTKNGWMCYDRQGRSATGITKAIAKSQYNLYYNILEDNKLVSNNIDFTQYNQKL